MKPWRPPAATELVEDPEALRFKRRHRVDVAPGPLSLLMRFTEALIAAQPQQSGPTPNYCAL
jgi:hypothetical protein